MAALLVAAVARGWVSEGAQGDGQVMPRRALSWVLKLWDGQLTGVQLAQWLNCPTWDNQLAAAMSAVPWAKGAVS